MPLEYPNQTYIPGAKIRLTIRFDEFGNTSALAAPPAKSTKNLNGVKDPRAPLQVQPDPAAPPGITRFILLPQGQTAAPPATDQQTSSDGLTFSMTIVPKELSWELNGVRSADKLTATIRYVDCPIDPRTIRMCAVEGFVGTIKEEDYKAGVHGAKRANGDPLSILPDGYTDPSGQQRTNTRFLGWVDTWDVEWSDDGEPVIRLACTDNTRLLIEQMRPANLNLDMSKPLDSAVANYLSHFNAMQGLSVEYRPSTDTPPILNKVLANTAFRPNLGPPPAKGGGGQEQHSVWDYLNEVCGSVGHSIFVQGTIVVIQRARSLLATTTVSRADDPFKGRTLTGTGEQLTYRRFIYGKNIKEMRITRNFTKQVPGNIEVRCYSTEKKTVLVARFPLPSDRMKMKYAIPGNAQPDQKWNVKYVYGIKDLITLRAIAQSYYEAFGRQELAAEIKTNNLASFGAGNLDPDILDIQIGDTFEVLVKRDEKEFSTMTKIEKLLDVQASNERFLKILGFSDGFAAAYGKAYADAGFTTQFRTHSMKLSYSNDEGISIALQGVNYIEVRADNLLPKGEEPSTTTTNAPPNTPQGVNSP